MRQRVVGEVTCEQVFRQRSCARSRRSCARSHDPRDAACDALVESPSPVMSAGAGARIATGRLRLFQRRREMLRRTGFAACAGGLVWLLSAGAWAQATPDTATEEQKKEAFDAYSQGKASYEAGDYVAALAAFERSQSAV